MDEDLRNPARFLQLIKNEETSKGRGLLKIFFGYAAGVGKTYAMLEAAHRAKDQGIDVVVGYIEPHSRPATTALLKRLEVIPPKEIRHGDITLKEFDLDAALKRKPTLILVDELAHTNAPGSRHHKRYQDIEELLRAGINVYTTVNVQHIESLNDTVALITKIQVRERIPDYVFDNADQVEVVDIEPGDLVERLQEGKIYKEQQAQRALSNFFTVPNLTALREIALRRCADHINTQSNSEQSPDYQTEEHILVCLSTSPSNEKIIRAAARMAKAFKGSFTALFVETPECQDMPEKDAQRLRDNMRLAEQLGARVEKVYGTDIAYQIAEFSRLYHVTKIVIGRNTRFRKRFLKGQDLIDRLVTLAPNSDIHIIPDATNSTGFQGSGWHMLRFSMSDFLKSFLILAAASGIGFIFDYLHFAEANIITVYVLAVLIISIVTQNRIYSLVSSVLSVLVFNFLFTEERWSLNVYDGGYLVTFVIMAIAAFLTSSLAIKLKDHARSAALSAYRNKILFDVNQSLQQSNSRMEIFDSTAFHLKQLLQTDIVMYPVSNGKLEDPKVYYFDDFAEHHTDYKDSSEEAVAFWVLKNNKHAGATTQTLSGAKCLYLAIRMRDDVYGIIGIAAGPKTIDSSEKSILLSILGECALALENDMNSREKEQAAIIAQKEQLRANLLRAISHDLRTPLTSISGNASNFLSNEDKMDEATKRQLFQDIYNDSMWLINLVENLLSVSRLDDNQLNITFSYELVSDVIDEALKHIDRNATDYHIKVVCDDEFLLAQMDARLIVQVIINLVDNAIKYTPKGSDITIHAKPDHDMVAISVSDNGPGIDDATKEKVFDMFYSGSNPISDSRRSLGLGLYLCKSIVSAHGGRIWVSDNKGGHGATFTFTLPMKEVKVYE